SVVAPPFPRFFIEFAHVPENEMGFGFGAWGVLFTQAEPGTFATWHDLDARYKDEDEDEGWLLRAVLVGEWRKGKPVAPVMTWLIPLDRDGFLFGGDEQGYGTLFGSIPKIEGVPPEVA